MADSAEEANENLKPTLSQLEAQLEEVEERLRRELRARGFNPDQYDNLALTAPLAKLYTERENIKATMVALSDGDGDSSTLESDSLD